MMKRNYRIHHTKGSVLITTLLTITLLVLICATSLYIVAQNASSNVQSASWQQALSGAESAVDQAFNTLNLSAQQGGGGPWNGWKNVRWTSLPTLPITQPTPSSGSFPNADKPPLPGYLNLYVAPTLSFAAGTEGNGSVSSWVTIDTTAPSPAPSPMPFKDKNGNQWFRVRATGTAGVPGRKRVSSQRLDDDLRKLSLVFDRKAGGTVSSPIASRTIEVIAAPQPKDRYFYGLVLRNSVNMNGNTFIDSFDSRDPTKSTLGQWDLLKRQSHGNVATNNSTNSNLHNEPIYGNLAYSGPPIAGTKNVTGTISTPFNAPLPDTSDPSWSGSFNTYSGVPGSGSLTATSTDKNNPTRVKINGDFKTTGGVPFTIINGNVLNPTYINIWVTGDFVTNGTVIQQLGVYVTWYVDGNISTGGSSYTNLNGVASYTNFIGIGTGTISVSGSSTFTAVVNAPGYDVTIGGTGDMSGSLAANSLSMNGSGNYHYDEALAALATTTTIANYSFASWFEDNSAPARGQTF
jgi:hypothetical protein